MLIDREVRRFFDISNSNTQDQNFKIKRFSVNNTGNEFSNRSVNVWNSLPDAVVNCNSLSLIEYKLESCNIDNYCTRIHQSYLCNYIAYTIRAAFYSSVDCSLVNAVLFVLHFILLQTVVQLMQYYLCCILFFCRLQFSYVQFQLHLVITFIPLQ